jgi:hypothetical protein
LFLNLNGAAKIALIRAAQSTQPLCALWFCFMATEIKESDWKLFRRFHKIALERFCERVLKEVQAAAAEHADGYHDSYLKVFALIRDRDRTIASAFNDPRRSNALILLASIKHEGLLTAAELDQFSPEARQAIDVIESVWP